MSDTAIKVESLSKRYRIGLKEELHDTFSGAIASWAKSPISNFRRLRKLSRFDENGDGEDVIWALKDISFEVKEGEVIGIIGMNGAGKSTLLKILSRITEPTAGRVQIRGRVSSLLEVGTGFHPELSGRENIYLNAAILGMKRSEIERRFDEIVDFAGVERFLDTPVKRYSSGMRVRLAFSVAAHIEPEILLVDEVLAVGDAAFQKRCLGKMGEVAHQGRTVLFVSHNMGAVSNLCRSTVCLENGRIVDMGETDPVVANYINRTFADMPDQGIADLRSTQRSPTLSDRHAQFEWVKTLNTQQRQTATFLEREGIVIEIVFVVRKTIRNIQLGCSVFRLSPSIELFTVPSEEYTGEFPIGTYSARLPIDPNYLREGSYTLALKMFADGVRQDTVTETVLFHVLQRVSAEEGTPHFRHLVAGPLRLPYKWEEIQATFETVLYKNPKPVNDAAI